MLGREYVFVRNSGRLTFTIKRAHLIAGRWYTRSIDRGSVERQRPAPEKKTYIYWMLTPENKITDFAEFEPGSMVSTHELWLPLTKKVEAWLVMLDK